MRIAIVNDLAIAIEAMRRLLIRSGHSIAWTAGNGSEALALCRQDAPELLIMDLVMPGMSGVSATRRIMSESPCPILIATSTVEGRSADVFEALGAGALDAVDTPAAGASSADANAAFLAKIETVGRLVARTSAGHGSDDAAIPGRRNGRSGARLVAIGASAGGPAALAAVLAGLPSDFPAGIVIIQHVDARFAEGLADWLNQQSGLPVRIARTGDRVTTGRVFVAGTSNHLVLLDGETLGYSANPAECFYRPSVNVFFDSVVRHWQGAAVGVLLTGMGRDGACGLKSLRNAGHYTLAQDRDTSAVYGMPAAAAEVGAAVDILPIAGIADRLRSVVAGECRSELSREGVPAR